MTSRSARHVLLLGLLLVSARAGAGSLVLVGGALEDERIIREIVRRAGGPGHARIGILTASSQPESQDRHAGTPEASNARANGAAYVEQFAKFGAEAVWLPVDLDHIANNRDPALVKTVGTLTGVFFGGGDQSRYLTTLVEPDGKDSPLLRAIRTGYRRRDFVLAGTSAGTAVMVAGPMITGGTSETALDRPTPSSPRGLGFFPRGLLDTHFGQRERQARIVRLAADQGQEIAFGIDEDTALLVDDPLGKNPKMKVLGKNGVSVFRLNRARIASTPWSIKQVGFSYLTDADAYHLGSHRTFVARSKPRVGAPDAGQIAGSMARLTTDARSRFYQSATDGSGHPSARGVKLSLSR